MSEKKLQETSFYSAFSVQLRLLSVTQENIIDLGSQNPSRSPKAIKLLLKFEVFQLRKVGALGFCVSDLTKFSDLCQGKCHSPE
jgi:hypothetical protein